MLLYNKYDGNPDYFYQVLFVIKLVQGNLELQQLRRNFKYE